MMLHRLIDTDSIRNELVQALDSKLDTEGRQIAVYGAGNTSRLYDTANSFAAEGIDPVYFIDNNPTLKGTTFAGKPVINFEEAHTLCKGFLILVCAGMPAGPKILEALLQDPIENTSVYMLDEYVFCQRSAEILAVYDLLEDDVSKATYANIVLCRMNKVEQNCDYLCSNQYYGIPEFTKRRNNEIFVDCGAYVGDSMEQYLLNKDGVFEKIFAFEPEPANFQALLARTERLKREWALAEDRIVPVRAGIGAKSDNLSMIGHAVGSASLGAMFCADSDEDGEKLPVYALDDFFQDQRVSLIKADIEGFEWNLLEGATDVIRKNHPKLAICIYHSASDIYRLALKIKEIWPDYRFSVRQHYCELAETVLYAY